MSKYPVSRILPTERVKILVYIYINPHRNQCPAATAAAPPTVSTQTFAETLISGLLISGFHKI